MICKEKRIFRGFANIVGPRQSTVDTETDLRFVAISYIQGLSYKLKMFLGKF
jgi:hypothetical protein